MSIKTVANKPKNKYIRILLLGALIASGFGAMSTQAITASSEQALLEQVYGFADLARQCVYRLGASIAQAIPFTEQALIDRAYALAGLVAHENACANKVKIDSLTFEMVTAAGVSASAEMVASNSTGSHKTVRIKLNESLLYASRVVQDQTILHELAHAYDNHLWNVAQRSDPAFDCYPHLEDGILVCKKQCDDLRIGSPRMMASEWHAEWQSLQWFKKFMPGSVEKLKQYYQGRAKAEAEMSIHAFDYPPATILLTWI